MYPRIHADFNGLGQVGENCSLVVDSYWTLRDLAYHRIRFREGMRLVFWDVSDDFEDLEVEAELRYDPYWKKWYGDFPANAIRDVPTKNRDCNVPFLCFSCRSDVTKKFPNFWSHIPMICPTCGASLMVPMEAPEPANKAPDPTTRSVTPPAGAGDRAAPGRGSS